MSNVESNELQHASATGRMVVSPARAESKARVAREFLIHLVSREIQLSGHVAGWLRSTGQALAQRQLTDLSGDCVRLAAETWQLREQLVALAHRLVARRNRGLSHRRINVMFLLEQPSSPAMLAFIELNQQIVEGAVPAVELAVVSAVEQLLSGVVPLAIDVAGFDSVSGGDSATDDLAEVAEAYEARFARAEALRRLVAAVAVAMPESSNALRDAGDAAIEHYTQIIRESAELGAHLMGASPLASAGDGRRTSVC